MLWQPVGSEAAWSGCDTILDPGLLLRPAMNNSELLQALKLKMKELSEASPYILPLYCLLAFAKQGVYLVCPTSK